MTRFGCKAKIWFCAVFNDLKELIGYAIDTFYEDGFYYAYQVDEDNCLARIFWADAQARMNYSFFGDTITFDPTYGTNKYHMAFTPFIGVDNHKKSVTFVFFAHLSIMRTMVHLFGCLRSSLIIWATRNLGAFLPIKIRQLNSGALRIQESKTSLLHVAYNEKNLPIKLRHRFLRRPTLLSEYVRLFGILDLEPIEFEEKWSQVITDSELNDNTWLTYMYGKRDKWIPAYFRDLPLGCLLKTTQRSESQNNYFKRFESIDGTLVEFWLRFPSAIEKQCYNQRFLDALQVTKTLPQVSSKTMIEKHASKIYTHTVFYEFQEQVQMAPCSCAVRGFSEQGNMQIIHVEDAYMKHRIFQVIQFYKDNCLFTLTYNNCVKRIQ
ncbi:protein FAR1-RELATED SEQUENCE 5-like [Silene latifolia]|uniref:protein FAR1-RELATED SEQUENCE 5-like n=1 Tax=Silene latifolia TaxID=37657 RepID=UPI003D78235E